MHGIYRSDLRVFGGIVEKTQEYHAAHEEDTHNDERSDETLFAPPEDRRDLVIFLVIEKIKIVVVFESHEITIARTISQ